MSITQGNLNLSQSAARIVTDQHLLTDRLEENPLSCAYIIGHLEEGYQDFCTWYAAGPEDEPHTIVLVFSGHSIPALLCHGQTGALEQIFEAFHDKMPGRSLAQLQPHHVAAVDPFFSTEGLVPMLRMGLAATDFRAGDTDTTSWEIQALSHRHTGMIIALYQHYYPDNWFEPAQLDSGHYCGIIKDGQLISVAGVHAVSPKGKLAVLGNIVTHPDHRGQGLSTACTSHLCTRLFEEDIEVLALNVRRQNRSAVRVYEKIGFRYHDTYLEGVVTHSSAI